MTSARDVMTARINAALARYDEAIGQNMWRTTARNQALDHILQGWDKTVLAAVASAIEAATQPPQPTAAEQAAAAARRAELDEVLSAQHVRSLRRTKAVSA